MLDWGFSFSKTPILTFFGVNYIAYLGLFSIGPNARWLFWSKYRNIWIINKQCLAQKDYLSVKFYLYVF